MKTEKLFGGWSEVMAYLDGPITFKTITIGRTLDGNFKVIVEGKDKYCPECGQKI